LGEFSPLFEEDVYQSLSVESSIASKSAPGGTSFDRVNASLRKARIEVEKNR